MLHLIVIATILSTVIVLLLSRVLRHLDFLHPTTDGNFQSSLYEHFSDKLLNLLLKSGLYHMRVTEKNLKGCACRNLVNDKLIVLHRHNNIGFCHEIWVFDDSGLSLPGKASHSSVYINNFTSFFLRCNKVISYCQHLYLECQRLSMVFIALVCFVMVKLHLILFSAFADTCSGIVDSISDDNLVVWKRLKFLLKYMYIDFDSILLSRHKSCVQSTSLEDLIRVLSIRWTKPYNWIYKRFNSFIPTDYFIFPVTSMPSRLNSFAPLLKNASKAQHIFFTGLASAGFRLVSKNSNVVCESCDQKWKIDNFDAPPESIKFHKWNCTFVCKDVVNGSKPDINDSLVEVDGQPFYTCQESEDKHLTEQKNDTKLFESLKELQILLEHKNDSDTLKDHSNQDNSLSGSSKVRSLVLNKTSSLSLGQNNFLSHKDNHDSASKTPVLGDERLDESCLAPGATPTTPLTPKSIDTTFPLDTSAAWRDATVSNTSFDSGYFDTLNDDEQPEQSSFAGKETASQGYSQCTIEPDVQHYQDALSCEDNRSQCKNNSNHLNYIDIVQLRKVLRRNMRTPDMFKLFQLLKLLTVKITQSSDSSGGLHHVTYGTGSVIDTPCQITTNANGSFCGIVFVETSQHLIRDDSQAKLSIVDFFVHTQIRSRKIKGESIQPVSENSNGPVYLRCLTEEIDLVLYINQLQEEIKKLLQDITVDGEDILNINTFIISYPHGGEQAISYGRSVVVKYLLGNNEPDDTKLTFTLQKVTDIQKGLANRCLLRKMLMYAADTCPGCCGAPVLTFRMKTSELSGHKRLVMEKWMHQGYFTNEDFNVSYLKVCTDDDFMDWGWTSCDSSQQTLTQQITTNETAPTIHQEIISQSVIARSSQVAASLSNEPTVCVANLVEHPSYPVYIQLAQRLKSFKRWTHCNIHAPSQLAAAGFFYAGYGDCVRCFQCGLGLRSWKPGDDVIEEHQKYRPSCSFLKTYLESSTGNRRQDEIPITPGNENPSLSTENSPRSDSFYPRKHLELLMNSIQVPQSTGSHNEISQAESSITEPCQDCSKSTKLDAVSTIEQAETTLIIPDAENINLTSSLESENNSVEMSASSRADVTVQLLKKEKEMLETLMKCKECQVNPIQELFLPCGDLYSCSQCLNKFTHCPACGQRILGTVTTYFA